MTLKQKEDSVLNLFMDAPNLFDGIEHLVFEEVWSTQLNKHKFKIIKSYHAKNIKPDGLLMQGALKKLGYTNKDILDQYGEPDYRIEKNIEEYVKEIFDAWCRKSLNVTIQSVHSELQSDAGDVDHNIELLKEEINNIESIKNNVSKDKKIEDVFEDTLKELSDRRSDDRLLTGYSTGLKDLDRLCNGIKQEVIVIGAPPAAGKSSLMVEIICNTAIKNDAPVLVHSLEMPSKELMRNIWANCLQVNSNNIRGGSIDDETFDKIKDFKHKLKDNLVIDDTPGITYQYIETRVRRMRSKIPMDKTIVVFIDYLQLMRNIPEETKGVSSEEQLGIRCNGLLELSKRYNLCMIELSQLGRELSKRDNKKPLMSDFKGSGAIEANAVQCWLLYRPDYYEENPEENGMSLKGLCEINVAKNRYGSTGRVYVEFLPKYSSFRDYDPMAKAGINTSYKGDTF
jgi:replicative DNA helicase